MPHNLVIHADVNASYNIMGKVFKGIKYNHLEHDLHSILIKYFK